MKRMRDVEQPLLGGAREGRRRVVARGRVGIGMGVDMKQREVGVFAMQRGNVTAPSPPIVTGTAPASTMRRTAASIAG
jgi:hypothetical protein